MVSFHTEINCFFLGHTEITEITETCNWLEPVRSAALDGDSAKNSGDDCGKELEYLGHVVPVDFHNEHEF